MAQPNPFLLAAGPDDPTPALRPLLTSNSALATQQDAHGYSLLHAASSYSHANLLRCLVSEFHANPNTLLDEDGETCLFVAENVEVARVLVEELGCDVHLRNHEGMTAREKIEAEGDWMEIAVYLRLKELEGSLGGNGDGETTHPPPPLPPNMTLDIKTSEQAAEVNGAPAQEPDPEFRRRIEELAAREDFHSEQGQKDLRELITDAVLGVRPGGGGDDDEEEGEKKGEEKREAKRRAG